MVTVGVEASTFTLLAGWPLRLLSLCLLSMRSVDQIMVPGTRMRHVAITDPAEQDYLISFLRTLK